MSYHQVEAEDAAITPPDNKQIEDIIIEAP